MRFAGIVAFRERLSRYRIDQIAGELGQITGSHLRGRNLAASDDLRSLPLPLIGEEEERPVANDRTAQRPAELVPQETFLF